MRAAALVLVACSLAACDSSPSGPPPAASSVAPVVAAPPAPPAPETKSHEALAERTAIKEGLAKERKAVLAGLAKALAGLTPARAKDALLELDALRIKDPSGAALAVSAARAAKAAGDTEAARRWLAAARVFGQQDPRIEGVIAKTWPDAPPAVEPQAVVGKPAKSLLEACAELEKQVARLPLAHPTAKLSCAQERTLKLGADKLRSATVLRLGSTSEPGVRQELAYVALHAGDDFVTYGPVAYAVSVPAQGAVSDFVVDLQHVDVLPGGAPELVVRVLERATSVDVALNEVAKLDQTRVVLLTADKGGLTASRELTLSRSAGREALDAKDKAMPAGFARAKNLGKTSGFELKVEWGLANEIRLKKTSGDEAPRQEGTITLF